MNTHTYALELMERGWVVSTQSPLFDIRTMSGGLSHRSTEARAEKFDEVITARGLTIDDALETLCEKVRRLEDGC